MKTADLGAPVKPMGATAPESATTVIDVSKDIAPRFGLPGMTPQEAEASPGGIDYAVAFGGKKNPVTPSAETPAQRPFPAQGEPTAKPKAPDGYYLYRGFHGIPFRCRTSRAPDVKASDTRQPHIVADAHVRIFDMSKPEDLKEYAAVWDAITKGRCAMSSEDKQWAPEKGTWMIMLRWGERFWELPED